MNDLFLVGLNHKTAPVELREKCRVEDLPGALGDVSALAGETAILSTCNRLEVYVSETPAPEKYFDWMASLAGVPAQEIRDHAYVRQGRNAAKHLFFVASSLDSLVVGETQIRNQVKVAYREATEAGTVGVALHRLFQAAMRVSKEIAEQTGIGRGSVSVAGAAADLAERVFGDLAGARVLVAGAGETAELVMHHLVSRGVGRFFVVNRTPEHAQRLADRFEAEAGGLDALPRYLVAADVVVAAAGGDEPVVRVREVSRALRRRRGRPIVAIDLAVPRGIDRALDRLDNVYRYDMEALKKVTEDALRHRRKDFIDCCTMVDGATLRLELEARSHAAGSAISELEEAYEEVAERELESLERRLPEAEREPVRRAVRRIVRKLLHMPVRALRQGSPEESDVVRRAFMVPRDEEGE